jgi:two-component system phosphate regulon sensor histidine kinase PhoR
MGFLARRTLSAVAAAGAGALAGFLAGVAAADAQAVMAVMGALAGAGWRAWVDARHGQAFVDWLAQPEVPAPRAPGLWGEAAYLCERALGKREQSALRETERLTQFLSAIEASPNGVLLLDPADQVTWLNPTAAAHFGLDRQRDMGQRLTNLVRSPAFVAYMQAGAFDSAITFAAPGGQATLAVLVRPYGSEMKLVITQDITERERAEAMRRDFVANVSHEIRTPLTVLAGFVETMSGLPLTEPERRRVLVLMTQQTERMQALVSDLLTLAQLEGSPRPPPDTWMPVADLMRRAMADAAALSSGRHALQASGGEGVALAGAATELFSAASNLVNNAVRYTPEGGSVRVKWHVREDGAGVLEVADSGPGIAREHIPRLTERFYRVDGSRSRETGGTGLGLAIVKHVVQRHGGEIEVESEVGKGSTFRLVFPVVRVRTQLSAPAAGEAAAAH